MPWQPRDQPQPWNQGWKNPYGRYSQYQQYLPPQLPQAQAQNANPQLYLPFPQRPSQLPIQPLPNSNNKTSQPIYNLEEQNPQTYMTTPLDLNNVQLMSGRV